jgi:hypothetical protein
MPRFFGGHFFKKFPAPPPAIFQIARLVLKADRQIKKRTLKIIKPDLDKGCCRSGNRVSGFDFVMWGVGNGI